MGENPKGPELESVHLERFKRIVSEEASKVWSIIIAQIDPDGVGSAMLMKLALESLGVEASIFYSGTVGHPQNRTMWNHYELDNDMRPLTDLPPEGPIALVDSSKYDDMRFGMKIAHERFRIVVDHHHDPHHASKNCKDKFVWVASVGAASTLAHILAKALGVTPNERVATCAAIGVHSDTDKLISEHTTEEDRQAFSELMRVGDQKAFNICCNFEYPSRYRDLLVQALTTVVEVNEIAIAHPTELLRGDEGDLLSIISNHLIRHEGPDTVIVWGISGNEIRASVRTSSTGEKLNDLIAEIFGKGVGGAKRGSGGARLPIPNPFNASDTTAPDLIGFLAKTFIHRLEVRVGVKKRAKPGSDS